MRWSQELRAADTSCSAVPMYNFRVPSTLKAYFDHVARAGVTFRYTAQGPAGLLDRQARRRVRRPAAASTPGRRAIRRARTLREFLAFLGITDVEFVYAEGLAMGDAPRAAGLERAHATLAALPVNEPLAA